MKAVKSIIRFLFSMQFMGIVVILLALSMAVATFVENRNGTIAAQALIYQAWWFELAILLAFVNILASIIRLKLYNLKRLPIFLFHVAFLVVILGAAFTRYVGKEGIIHIREGETTSAYLSAQTYFFVRAESTSGTAEKYQKVYLSPASKKNVNMKLRLGEDRIRIKSVEYVSGDQMNMGNMETSANQAHADVAQIRLTINSGSEEVMVRGMQGSEFIPNEFEISGIKLTLSFGSRPLELPFKLHLNDFILDRYPGSGMPSSFLSEVTVVNDQNQATKPYKIFMNNILTHGGYRFYQSSYDGDEQGTVLSVNHDGLGTAVTYTGYFLMIGFIILSFFAPGSRFKRLLKESRKSAIAGIALLMLLLPSLNASAQGYPKAPNAEEAKAFGKIWVLGTEGRVKPVSTLAQEMIRKVFGENKVAGMSPEQLWLSMLTEPEKWANIRMIPVKNQEIANQFKVTGGKASYNDFFKEDQFLIGDLVTEADRKKPNQRNGLDKTVMKLDEALNIVYMSFTGQLLEIFPDPRDPKAKWYVPSHAPSGLTPEDSIMIHSSFGSYLDALRAGDVAQARSLRKAITGFQNKYGSSILPGARKANLEVFYNKALIFERLAIFYALIGFLFLIAQLWSLFKPADWQNKSSRVFGILLFAGWILHTFGLALRWYLSGHAPMSNGYESMIFVAWGTLLAGFLVSRRSMLPLALTGVLAALSLLVAHMSWMNPQITPLVPVLKSVWLTIHVAVIMTSYSFLGLGALIGLISMILFISKTKRNQEQMNAHIRHLTRLNRIVIMVGLYLITIGCFLGAIWANQSWGRYWGWDPKETWCLITILVYSFVGHMHNIKGFETDFALNFGSLMGFGAVLMTYFGVNYFLHGMHSYAADDAASLPVFVYVVLIALVALVYAAYFKELSFQPKKK